IASGAKQSRADRGSARRDCFVVPLLAMMGWMAPSTASMCQSWVVDNANGREPSMKEVTTIGLDLAKNVFQVHAVDRTGAVVVRRALRRSQVLAWFAKLPPCLVGMEACATAHYWGRELRERTMLRNQLRGMMAEFGVVAAQG